MPPSNPPDWPGIDPSQFSASFVETSGAVHTLTVSGEASGDYRVEQVELVRDSHQNSDTTLVLDVKAKLGPVENPHPEFIRVIPLTFKEEPGKRHYTHVKIVNGVEHFTINVVDVL
jgi:hypothetical protein